MKRRTMPEKDWTDDWKAKPKWLREWTEKISEAVHYNNQSGGKNEVANILLEMINEYDKKHRANY